MTALLTLSLSLLAQENSTQSKQNETFQAGVHYTLINPPWPDASEHPVVYEFFNYKCPGCNAFEPYMEQIEHQLTDQQKVVRVPVIFNAAWKPFTQAYYALAAMDQLEPAHKALFHAIHKQKKNLRNLEDIASWLGSEFNIDAAEFLTTANSFAVDSQVRKGVQMANKLGVSRIPTVIVNGKYKLNFKQLQTPTAITDAVAYLLTQQ